MQFIIIGTTKDGLEGFAVQGYYSSAAWGRKMYADAYQRAPGAIHGIREIKRGFDGYPDQQKRADEILALIDGEGLWHREHRSPAKIAQDLGWC